MCRFLKFLHIWRNFRCLPMTYVEKSEILHIWHVFDVENVAIYAKFMLFSWKNQFCENLRTLSRNPFCCNLRTFVWRKIYPKIFFVEKKWQIWGLENLTWKGLFMSIYVGNRPPELYKICNINFTGCHLCSMSLTASSLRRVNFIQVSYFEIQLAQLDQSKRKTFGGKELICTDSIWYSCICYTHTLAVEYQLFLDYLRSTIRGNWFCVGKK